MSIPVSLVIESMKVEELPFKGIHIKKQIQIANTMYGINKNKIFERIFFLEESQIIDPKIRKSILDFQKFLNMLEEHKLRDGSFFSLYKDNLCLSVYLSILATDFKLMSDSDLISFFYHYDKYSGLHFDHLTRCSECVNHYQLCSVQNKIPVREDFHQMVSYAIKEHINSNTNYHDIWRDKIKEQNDNQILDRFIIFYTTSILVSTCVLTWKLVNCL